MGKTSVAFCVISAILALSCSSSLAAREIADGSSFGRGLLTIPSLEEIKASCDASAVGFLFVTGGTGTLTASATCEAFAAAISDIEVIWAEYLEFIDTVPRDYCVVIELEKVIRRCARAIASVYASAYVEVTIDGTGIGCAEAFAQGDARARAFAAVFVNLWLGLTNGPSTAEADLLVGTLEFAIASAWAAAEAAVCQINSGSASDYENAYAVQITEAIACVWIEVVVGLCEYRLENYALSNPCDVCDNGELNAYYTQTFSTARAGVCSTNTVVVDQSSGNAGTGAPTRPGACTGNKRRCCSRPSAQNSCRCGRTCSLTRVDSIIWRDNNDGSSCSCVDASDLLG